jgi:hypothetical protein
MTCFNLRIQPCKASQVSRKYRAREKTTTTNQVLPSITFLESTCQPSVQSPGRTTSAIPRRRSLPRTSCVQAFTRKQMMCSSGCWTKSNTSRSTGPLLTRLPRQLATMAVERDRKSIILHLRRHHQLQTCPLLSPFLPHRRHFRAHRPPQQMTTMVTLQRVSPHYLYPRYLLALHSGTLVHLSLSQNLSSIQTTRSTAGASSVVTMLR